MRRPIPLLIALCVAAVPVAEAHKGKDDKRGPKGPAVIQLPAGWAPEGIAAGPGHTAFVGSIPTGRVYAANVRTGEGEVRVPQREGRAAIGLKYDRATGDLFVAGGPTGSLFVYDARTGDDVAQFPVGGGFVNDVVISRGTAYFTDSRKPVFYALPTAGGAPRTVPITGDLVYTEGNNANGIVAARKGRTLITVAGNQGKLFTLDPQTGVSDEIDLGGAALPNGDGLLLEGRTLRVVQNRLDKVAVVRLSEDLSSGRVVKEITNPAFDVPTTIARIHRSIYAVNAKFGTPPEGTPYEVVRVTSSKRARRR